MQDYSLREFSFSVAVFFLLSTSVLSTSFEYSLFDFENRTIHEENYTDDRHFVYNESNNQSSLIFIELEDYRSRIPVVGNESSVFAFDSKVTVETDHGNWRTSISKMLDLSMLERVDSNGTDVDAISFDNLFNGLLMFYNGSSMHIEPFKNQNNSAINTNVVLSANKTSDAKFKDCSSMNGNKSCQENNFPGSLYCWKETKKRISCYFNFNKTEHDLKQHFESGRISVTSRKVIPQYSTKKAVCNILITGDNSYYAMHNHDIENAISEIHLIFKQVNRILSSADFDSDELQDNLSLRIQDIVLKEATNTSRGYNSSHDITKLVDEFRKVPQDYCMSLLFIAVPTDSDFASTAYIGGICKHNRNEPDPARNIALTNLVDSHGYKRSVFANAWTVAMAVGQVMGSAVSDCDPMLPFPPEEHWTSFFSDCGRKNIANLLTTEGSCLEFPGNEKEDFTKAPSKSKKTKQKVPTKVEEEVLKSSCGDGRVDPGEECDCGTEQNCKKMQSCCVPPGVKRECQYDRSKGYECDWPEDCCTRTCKIVPKSWNLFCGRGDSSCAPNGSYCNGRNSRCPVPKLASNFLNGETCGPGTLKQLGASTCQHGRCNSTVCRDAGLEDCMCAASTGQECRVCCKMFGSIENRKRESASSVCIPAEYFELKPKKGKFFYRHPGTLCSEVRLGHCNGYGKCLQLSMVQSSAISQVLHRHLYSFIATSTHCLLLVVLFALTNFFVIYNEITLY